MHTVLSDMPRMPSGGHPRQLQAVGVSNTSPVRKVRVGLNGHVSMICMPGNVKHILF